MKIMYLNRITIKKHTIFLKNTFQLLCTESNENLEKWNEVKTKFSDDQLIFVFQKLKKSNMMEMKKYGINESKMKILQHIKYEKKYKGSNILDEIISCNVMQVNELEELCDNITSVSSKIKQKSIISVRCGENNFKDIKTAVGIRVGATCVNWAQLDLTSCNCNILQLKSQRISITSLEAPEIIKMAMSIANTLPIADAYIMEKETVKVKTSNMNHSIMKLLLQKEQMLSGVISTILTNIDSKKSNSNTSSSLYFLRPFASAQYFKLYLGKETVSSNKIINAVLTNKYTGDLLSVSIANDILNYYHSVDYYAKEDLNLTILTTIMFLEKVVLENM